MGTSSRGGSAAKPSRVQLRRVTMDPSANICANFDAVGQAFITYYYQVFDNDRSQLGSLYKDEVSMLNFEHNPGRPGQFKGTAQILEKLQNLPFQKVQHQVVTIDCQPTPGRGCAGGGVREPPRGRRADPPKVFPGVPAASFGDGVVLHLQRRLPPQRRVNERGDVVARSIACGSARKDERHARTSYCVVYCAFKKSLCAQK